MPETSLLISLDCHKHLLLLLKIILFIESQVFELIIIDNGFVSKKIVSEVNEFKRKIKSDCLKQSLSRYLVEPVELEAERHEVKRTYGVFNSPVLPLNPEEVKLKGKHFH